jgi:hypothetical protein
LIPARGGRSDKLIRTPAHDTHRRRRGIADQVIEPDTRHHVVRAFGQQAEIGFLERKNPREALPALRLPHQEKADDRIQHHQRQHKRHPRDRRVTPRRQQLAVLHGRQENKRKPIAAPEEAHPLRLIGPNEIVGAACRLQRKVPEKGFVREVPPDRVCVVGVARDHVAVSI